MASEIGGPHEVTWTKGVLTKPHEVVLNLVAESHDEVLAILRDKRLVLASKDWIALTLVGGVEGAWTKELVSGDVSELQKVFIIETWTAFLLL